MWSVGDSGTSILHSILDYSHRPPTLSFCSDAPQTSLSFLLKEFSGFLSPACAMLWFWDWKWWCRNSWKSRLWEEACGREAQTCSFSLYLPHSAASVVTLFHTRVGKLGRTSTALLYWTPERKLHVRCNLCVVGILSLCMLNQGVFYTLWLWVLLKDA